MNLKKRIKCIHCDDTLECNDTVCVKTCFCGKISLNCGVITEGVLGKDYIDVSQKLLNE